MNGTMRAVRGHRRGGPEELIYEVAPKPVPAHGDVLVEVRAASVTPGELGWDATWTDGLDGGSPRLPVVPSKEVSGVVAELGHGVTEFRPGEAVYGLIPFTRDGAAAEFVTVPAAVLAAKPGSLDHERAASLPLAGLTAWQGLADHAGATSGARVLVHGGAGGVGSLAVQIAAALGGEVTATASAGDMDFVRGLGADDVVDYVRQRFEDEVKDADIVFDTVGGDTLARSWEVLRPGGVLVSVAEPAEPPQGSDARGVFFVVEPDRAGLEELTALVEAGRLIPQVDRIVPLESAPGAYAALERERRRGKIVLRVS
ncbi:NADP-dependent oxidoreductase [Streptomyces triticiradicis]|uniref:NADP-dependent oxidoreductase n=1 Tax=Streptomyces triticiradicis TaxID=2651189 RepID=A0A7J5DPE0_9ACTN|nr:NADP-dependent oxidoreductase [Streptomyces triticiradicis]KAB1990606.1 NADP-dependent oxidoreductase [Streptomyces triticiradicis]